MSVSDLDMNPKKVKTGDFILAAKPKLLNEEEELTSLKMKTMLNLKQLGISNSIHESGELHDLNETFSPI